MRDLRESKEVNELLKTLEQNGMEKEKTEVNALVDYISDMEKTLIAMLAEMQEMRKEVSVIHDNTLRAKCGVLVQNTDKKILQGITTISKVKNNFIMLCKNATKTFKEKGKEALKDAMRSMMIPVTMDKLGGLFHKLSKSIKQDAEKLEIVHAEFQSAKYHFSNAFRSLFGKAPKEESGVNNDKDILLKYSKFQERLALVFYSLEKKTIDLADKIRVDRVKESVRAELNFFKGGDGDKQINSLAKDKVR